MREKIFEAKDVVIKFNLRGHTLTAIRGASIDLYDGETLAIVGESGSGKSVFTKSFIGMLDTNGWVEQGEMLLDGVNIAKYKTEKEWLKVRGKKIAMVFQDPMTGTAATMQIDENLALAARRGAGRTLRIGITKKENAEYHELLKTLGLGLEDRMTSKVGLLSGGQRQALTLMMATFNPPKLLLLDEHTAALDPATAEKVLALTKSIVSENNLTCLMITHNMQSALELGNRTIMMHGGNIIFDAEGEERSKLTVQDLLGKFKENAGKELDNDRMLLV